MFFPVSGCYSKRFLDLGTMIATQGRPVKFVLISRCDFPAESVADKAIEPSVVSGCVTIYGGLSSLPARLVKNEQIDYACKFASSF
jgi:hypothetical protein